MKLDLEDRFLGLLASPSFYDGLRFSGEVAAGACAWS
jgi:hypothetical protein